MLTAYIKVLEGILARDVSYLAAYIQGGKGKLCIMNQSLACALSPQLLPSEE